MGAAAIEIWTMDDGIYFDNVMVASDPAEAEKLRVNVWEVKLAIEVRGLLLVGSVWRDAARRSGLERCC